MSAYHKLVGTFNRLKLARYMGPFGKTPDASALIQWDGPRMPGVLSSFAALDGSLRLASSIKNTYFQSFVPAGSSPTTGIGTGPTIHATVTLTTVAQVITTSFTQPDVARNVSLVGNQSAGDGTFVGATSKIVVIRGTNQFGAAIVESVALNATTPVRSQQAFATITEMDFPTRNASGDTVAITCGPALALERPVELAADLLVFEAKASAGVWAQIAMPGTYVIGYAWAKLSVAVAQETAGVHSTTFKYLTSSVAGTFPSAPFIVDVLEKDGTRESLMCTASSTSGSTVSLTCIRGLNGQTTVRRNHSPGAILSWRCPFTISPSITANDKYRLMYLSRTIGQ